jgi:hypothetical protein
MTQARSLGTLNLNDRVHTIYDFDVIPGTGYIQSEEMTDLSGQMIVVRVDKKSIVIPVELWWVDGDPVSIGGDGKTLQTFYDSLDAQQGVAFVMGDGWKYTTCWAPSSECIVKQRLVLGTDPKRCYYKISFNIHSRYATRAAV